jgi:hypothetical protein
MYRAMKSWIGDFFQSGHQLNEILDMTLDEYVFIVESLSQLRAQKPGESEGPRELRPVQRDAIKNLKKIKQIKK